MRRLARCVRVSVEVHLAPAAVRDVRVALRRSEIRMPEHLLDGPEVRASLEQVRREGVAEQMGVNPSRLEPCLVRELSQDEECAGSRQWAATCVQEQLGPVASVEMRTTEREVAPHRLGGWAPERDEPFLATLSDHSDDSLLERDAALVQADRLRDAQAGPVQELDERSVPKGTWRGARGRVDQALGLCRRQRARKLERTAW